MLQKTEKLFHDVAGEIKDSSNHNLLFHLLFEIQNDLHNQSALSANLGVSLNSLEAEAKKSKHNFLKKETQVVI